MAPQKNMKKIPNRPSPANRRDEERVTWQTVVRVILIVLIILAMTGSFFLGIFASAYSLPLPKTPTASTSLAEHSQSRALTQPIPLVYLADNGLQEGDRIDGRPAEDYLAVTDDLPEVAAPHAALFTKEGRIIFERDIDTAVTMASTTKMMTAIIALETMPLDSQLAVTYGAANTGGTSAGLEAGMTISLHDCLYALLLPSGNDAAVVIAENISGMESRFVELMNAKAVELGMSSTQYVDASGLSYDGHYTTVRDYMLLTQYCMANLTFREIVSTSRYEVNVSGVALSLETTDLLSYYLDEHIKPIGVKTGYTDEAGYCFVGAGQYNGLELYTIVFDCETPERRFVDTANLLEWGFRHYRTIELINTTQQVAEVALLSWLDQTVAAYVPVVVRIELFDLNGPIAQDITINDIEGEATRGQVCGSIIWEQGGEVLMTSAVVVDKTVLAPGFWEQLSIAWQRFWGGFKDEPAHSETSILLRSELNIPAPLPS